MPPRWQSLMPLMLLAGVLFWTTALGLGLRSLRAARSGASTPCGAHEPLRFEGGSSGVDVAREATPFGQTAW